MENRLATLVFLSAFFISCGAVYAQEKVVSAYSEVDRKEIIQLNDDFSVIYKVHQVTTIFSSEGLSHGNIIMPYDDLSRIMSFEGKIIDPKNDKVLQKVTPKELGDISTVSDGTFFEDHRVKVYKISAEKFPIKVEVSYEIRQAGNFYIRQWNPLQYYNQKTNSSIEVQYPEQLGLRYKPFNFDSKPDSSFVNGTVTFKWNLEMSPFEKSKDLKIACIKFHPINFSMEGYSSDMGSWDGFAKWIAKLNAGKDELPETLKSEIEKMVEGIDDDLTKIQILYQYLQKNYRYVSIQLGIGGWMPKPSTEVYGDKYGECKALSMMMKAMLKEVGIESQYTLVYAGEDEEDIEVDFPSNQFNHVILRVPMEEEVLWLECTSKYYPAGYLGSFTKNRHVLAITEDGGFIDKTPSYQGIEYNTYQLVNNLELKENGDAEIRGKYLFQGNPASDFLGVKYSLDQKDQKDYLNKNLGGSGLVLSDFQIETIENSIPTVKVTFTGILQKYSQNTAKRTIFPLSWKKINKSQLEFGSISISEEFTIASVQGLTLEGELPNINVEENELKISIDSDLSEGTLRLNKTIEVKVPEPSVKADLEKNVIRINSLLNKGIVFKKPD